MCSVAWLHFAFAYCFRGAVRAVVWVFAIVFNSPLLISLLAHAYAERAELGHSDTRTMANKDSGSQPGRHSSVYRYWLQPVKYEKCKSLPISIPIEIPIQFPISMPSNLSSKCKFNLPLEKDVVRAQFLTAAFGRLDSPQIAIENGHHHDEH